MHRFRRGPVRPISHQPDFHHHFPKPRVPDMTTISYETGQSPSHSTVIDLFEFKYDFWANVEVSEILNVDQFGSAVCLSRFLEWTPRWERGKINGEGRRRGQLKIWTRKGVHATAVTAGHCTHAELTSGYALASCYSCCVHSLPGLC